MRLYLFDLDGTLTDSRVGLYASSDPASPRSDVAR
jgi:phosphoglycolate phosphatase-like HAD superfamily hydrolase